MIVYVLLIYLAIGYFLCVKLKDPEQRVSLLAHVALVTFWPLLLLGWVVINLLERIEQWRE